MFLRRPRFWFCSLAVALVGALAFWSIAKTRPLAKLELPDGRSVALQSVTRASFIEQRERDSDYIARSWWERVKQLFASRTRKIRLQQPGPTFIFSGARQKGRSPDEHEHISAIRVAFDGDRFIEQRVSSYGKIAWWENPIFPRRDKTFRAQVRMASDWHDWELPNPLYGQPITEWEPQEFPIKRAIGDIEYTASGWRKGNSGPSLKFELRHRGAQVKWPVVSASMTLISDATGNVSSEPLSITEPAWKIQQTITTGKQAPLSPSHTVTLAGVKMPHPAEKSLQKVDGFPFPGITVYMGRVGDGSFRFVDGEPAEMDAKSLKAMEAGLAMSPRVLHASASANGRSWTVFGTTNTPILLFIKTSTEPKTPMIEHGYRKDGEWHDFRTLNHTGDGFVTAMTLQTDNATSGPIDVDLFWHEEFQVEIFVKPPPRELWTPKK